VEILVQFDRNNPFIAACKQQFGRLDILINNAGISIRHRFLEITEQEWHDVMEVNLSGVFRVAQQTARRMVASGGGVILNMGSTNGVAGYPFYADYNASKAGASSSRAPWRSNSDQPSASTRSARDLS
jgi:NAD(P)-dependent dehydrogenase (short-subunit alcohol dehydrogenase family)